jgi:hypothetical protein
MNCRNAFSTALFAALSAAALSCTAQDNKGTINDYLTDISGGTVTAAGLIGGVKSPITTIEGSQDLILAIQPFTSEEARKAGFGLAFTPAKSTLFPMAGSTYVSGPFMRLVGNLTLSYAQNEATFAGQNTKRQGFSLSTVYYFRLKDDPVWVASEAFKECADKSGATHAAAIDAIVRADPPVPEAERLAAIVALGDKRAADLFPCIDKKIAALPWNAAKASISIGQGRIRPEGDASLSLGRSWNLNAQMPAGDRGLVQISLREARSGLDPASLGKPTLAYTNSRLAAARLTWGGQAASDLRMMVEGSNSKSESAAAFRDTFMFALGIDKKLADGAWLEFRFGRNRTLATGKETNTGLLTLSIAPTLFAYKK